ncbi:MAG: hypothetical protein FWH41_04350 [Treponema sp.]|nr:hypothetical protein [Treponema sp.]
MRNLFFVFFCIIFSACASTETSILGTPILSEGDYFLFNKEGKTSDVSPVALNPVSTKDFITKGIIFVSSSVELNSNGNIINGSIITFEMLMQEVAKLDADDFINLRIDEIQTVSTAEGIIQTIKTNEWWNTQEGNEISIFNTGPSKIEYKATAIAIKYLPL